MHKLWKSAWLKVSQHGTTQRRTWRKVHLAFDEATNDVIAIELTTNAIDDASMPKPLPDQVVQPISRVGADGAYDRVKEYDYLEEHRIEPIIPPRTNAIIRTDEQGRDLVHARNEAVRSIEEVGLVRSKQQTAYHRRSKAEMGMYRLKITFRERLPSRLLANQQIGVRLKAACLNRFNQLGLSKTVKHNTAQSCNKAVWIYNNTGNSLFACILFHTMLNIGRPLFPADSTHNPLVDYPAIHYSVLAIDTGIVVFLWGSKTLARYRYA